MKKIFLTFLTVLMTISLMAQKTQYYDLIIQKTTPLLHLYGSGGIINWNNGDLLLTHTSNTLTLSGGDLLLSSTYSLGIGATTPLHKLVVVGAGANNRNIFNFVNSDLNKNRTSTTQARDTSSLNLWFSSGGSPLLTMVDKNGGVLFRVDSIGFGLGTSTPLTKLSVLTNRSVNLNAFNFVNSDINKRRDTFAQATDTSSFNLNFSPVGSPTLKITGKTANNLFSVDTSYVLTSGYVGIGNVNGTFSGLPQHKLEITTSSTTKLNAFNFVNTNNIRRNDPQQATDTSSFNMSFTTAGSPEINLSNKAGVSIIKIDSSRVTLGVPIMMYYGDTTVTLVPGTIVYKTSDSTFYGCRYKTVTGRKNWWALDH